MLCDFCKKNEATIYLEQLNAQGQKKKINICTECAIARGIGPDPQSLGQVVNLFNELSETAKKLAEINNRLCPVCGRKLGEIKRTGKVGCPECYAVFKNEIRFFLNKNGAKELYKGTMPARLSSFHSVLTDRIALQNKLNFAVEHEDYEKAAMYRDYLKALEKNPISSGESFSNESFSSEES